MLIMLSGCSDSEENLADSNIDITLLNLATYENGFEMDFKITNNSTVDITSIGFYMIFPFSDEKEFRLAGKSGESEILPSLAQSESAEFNIVIPHASEDSSSIDLESLLIKIVGNVDGEPFSVEGSINVLVN